MRYIYVIVLLFNILNYMYSQASLLGLDHVPILCKLKNPVVDLTPIDVEDIISFLQSQRGFVDEFRKTLTTNVKDVEKAVLVAQADNEDADLNFMELTEKYGYKAEEHEVTTSDGYVLTMQRIPGTGPAVFLMHPILGSSYDWITTGKDNLAYFLASQGYDVWFGNARGNKFARKHVSLSPECADFWDFSYDETGRYDLPAMIDYILNETGKTKLSFVGFSQGTTYFLVLGSELPEYNEKISLAVLLGPIAFLSHTRSPLLRLVALSFNLDYKILRLLGLNSVGSNTILARAVLRTLCGDNPVSKALCSSFFPLIAGPDLGQLKVSSLPVILGHYPGGGSVKTIQHDEQGINSDRFCQFDYGKEKNEAVYGSERPPDYPIEKITAPIVLFCGGYDWLANTTDVQRLMDKLPNVAGTRFIPTYNHVDFIWADNSDELVFKPILEFIKKYT